MRAGGVWQGGCGWKCPGKFVGKVVGYDLLVNDTGKILVVEYCRCLPACLCQQAEEQHSV